MRILSAILLAATIGLPLTGRGEMIAPPSAEVRAGLEAVGATTEAVPLASTPLIVTSTASGLVISAEPVSSEAEAWELTLLVLSNSLPSWQVSVLAVLNTDETWTTSLARLSFEGLGLAVAADGYSLPEAVGEMIKMRAAVSESRPFANAGPVGIAMKQYEQDPSQERLRNVRTLIERVNARKGRSAQ